MSEESSKHFYEFGSSSRMLCVSLFWGIIFISLELFVHSLLVMILLRDESSINVDLFSISEFLLSGFLLLGLRFRSSFVFLCCSAYTVACLIIKFFIMTNIWSAKTEKKLNLNLADDVYLLYSLIYVFIFLYYFEIILSIYRVIIAGGTGRECLNYIKIQQKRENIVRLSSLQLQNNKIYLHKEYPFMTRKG